MNLDEQYWSNRYVAQTHVWDLGTIAPPIKAYFDNIKNKQAHILIPGCGYGHEAQYLWEQGFKNITLVEFSVVAATHLQQKFKETSIRIVQEDFFKHEGKYDYIIEHTFFCALDPSLRTQYVQKMCSLLSNQGVLVGLLFNRTFENNPPFGGSMEEYHALFSPYFQWSCEPCYNSIPPRQGNEVFIQATVLTL